MISVDTKKKELVGDFKNAGQEWQPTGTPEPVRVHDFPGDAVGKAIPYGVYDMARNEAWVSVGRDHDTPAFAVASIRQWWTMMGRAAYPAGDGAAHHGRRGRQQWLSLAGVEARNCNGWPTTCACAIHVSHFPPGHQQVEQDRASAVLSHHGELARAAAPHV